MDQTIGEVARRTGVTERTLRYYEELGLLAPRRDSAGRRHYATEDLDRLYRIRLLREVGTPLADIDPDGADLLSLTTRHLTELDAHLSGLHRQRERVRTLEERLMSGQTPADEELLGVLTGLPDTDAQLARRTTLLVYADIETAHRHLVEVFGFAPGPLTRALDGRVIHGEVYAGDGVIWMHREAPEFGLASPATLGAATHCMAVHVDDLDTQFARMTAAGATIVGEPRIMSYGVREFSARDCEGGLWSFMEPLDPGTAEIDTADEIGAADHNPIARS